jgi:hypothetical protein
MAPIYNGISILIWLEKTACRPCTDFCGIASDGLYPFAVSHPSGSVPARLPPQNTLPGQQCRERGGVLTKC